MPTGFITKRSVDKCGPQQRQFILWDGGDGAVKGFGLLVLPSGVKSYVYQYRLGGRAGKTRRYTIGRHGSPWTPEKARVRAKALAEQVRKGEDPLIAQRATVAAQDRAAQAAREQERRTRELAFDAYATRFVEHGIRSDARDRTRADYAGILRTHVSPVLKAKPLPDITRADVVRVLDRIPAKQPAVRRIVFAVLRKLMNWAVSRGDIAKSPMDGMATPVAPASRDRVLSDAELAIVLEAAGRMGALFGPLYRLLFATGQRREEVAGLNWAELDRESATWTLPRERSKNGEANIIPLNRLALAALDGLAHANGAGDAIWPRKGLVFTMTGATGVSGFSRAKSRLDALTATIAAERAAEAGQDPDSFTVAPWRLHDARRTLATGLQRLGVRFEVTEAVLNHVSGSRGGVAGVYQRHGWTHEKRVALDAWADHCDRLQSPERDATNIVPLRPAGAQ
jgi:integrase